MDNKIIIAVLDGKGHQVEVKPDQTILDAILDAGIDAPYSCEGGFCTSCKAKLLEGEATMSNNETLYEDEVKEGYILSCVATPTTDICVVNFDE